MSKPERGSLTTLLMKKPLGQGAPAAVSLEQAESVLLSVPEVVHPNVRTSVHTEADTAAHTTASTDVHTGVQSDVQPTKLLNRGRRRTVRVPWTFKMPFELREELESVAHFNDLNMTEIAVEAIERHLKHFPHPPEVKARAGETE
jgi:hypothetical protein